MSTPSSTLRCLVTAGNTRERIDRVRDWGNVFTGNTGFAIAQALAEIAEVDLVTSNREHLASLGAAGRVRGHAFATHAELRDLLERLVTSRDYHAICMTAAVSDYRPSRVYEVVSRQRAEDGTERWVVRDAQREKVRSHFAELAVLGERTEKLVDLFRSTWGYRRLLVKFKLEVGIGRDELIAIGQASRRASGADYLVANTLEMVGGASAGAFLLSDGGEEWVPRAALAGRLRSLVRDHWAAAR